MSNDLAVSEHVHAGFDFGMLFDLLKANCVVYHNTDLSFLWSTRRFKILNPVHKLDNTFTFGLGELVGTSTAPASRLF